MTNRGSTKARTMTDSQLTARCLVVLDEVAATGMAVVITKGGKPVARIVPFDWNECDLQGNVIREGDLVRPSDARWATDR